RESSMRRSRKAKMATMIAWAKTTRPSSARLIQRARRTTTPKERSAWPVLDARSAAYSRTARRLGETAVAKRRRGACSKRFDESGVALSGAMASPCGGLLLGTRSHAGQELRQSRHIVFEAVLVENLGSRPFKRGLTRRGGGDLAQSLREVASIRAR